jgi:hypothetical protein
MTRIRGTRRTAAVALTTAAVAAVVCATAIVGLGHDHTTV